MVLHSVTDMIIIWNQIHLASIEKKYRTEIVYKKYENSSDPDRILKELIGRTQFCILECIYPDQGHQMRLVKPLNLCLNGKK